MKQKLHPILLGSILGVTVSLLGVAGFSAANLGGAEANTIRDSGSLLGHITLVAYDPDGNIKQYVQTDNRVVDQGEACALKAVTGSTTAATDCSSTPGSFNVIALGTGTTATDPNDVALVTETAVSGLARTGTGVVITVANDPTTTGAKPQYVKTFTPGVAGPTPVTEAGIFNSTNTTIDALLARQVFTSISLGNADQLVITWTITFAGA